MQLTANSLIESTDGVCALIFNVLPIARNSLWKKKQTEIYSVNSIFYIYRRDISKTLTKPLVEPITRYDPLELIELTSPSFCANVSDCRDVPYYIKKWIIFPSAEMFLLEMTSH